MKTLVASIALLLAGCCDEPRAKTSESKPAAAPFTVNGECQIGVSWRNAYEIVDNATGDRYIVVADSSGGIHIHPLRSK